MRAFLQYDREDARGFFGALLWIAGCWPRVCLALLRGPGRRRWRWRRRRRWRRSRRRGGGAGAGGGGGGRAAVAGGGGAGAAGRSQDEQTDLTTCAPGMVWDTKRRKCLMRHSGVLPDPDLTEYAYALAKADRYQEAIDVLDLLDNPNTPRALNYRGYATRKLGHTDEGIGYYLKSVALDPNYPRCASTLGKPTSSRASTTSPKSNCRRSKRFAVKTANIMRIWLRR